MPCLLSHQISPAWRGGWLQSLMALLILLLVLATQPGELKAAEQETYHDVPVLEALRSTKGETYGITATVTLVLAPGYLFLQDESGAIRVVSRDVPPVVIGDRLRVVVRNSGNRGRWFEAIRVEQLGAGTLPSPQAISPVTANPQEHDAAYVSVTGKVVGQFRNNPVYEVGGQRVKMTREVLLVESDGGSVDVVFDPVDRAFELFPVGTRAEFTGACRFPENSNIVDGPAFSVSVRGTDRVRVLQKPPVWMQPEFRELLVRGLWLGGALIAASIVWLLWRWRRRRLVRASEMKFRSLVENALDGVLVFKPSGELLYRNAGAARLFGESIRADLLMQNGSSPKIHPDDAPRILRTMEDLLAEPGRTSSKISYRVTVPGEGTRHVEATGTNCLDIPGIEGVVVNVRDITERHHAEEQLREANITLEQRVAERTVDLTRTQEELRAALKTEKELSELRANFVSLVSHEFRTPLGVIMSAADVLRLFFKELPEAKRERHLEMITRSTRTLANLIEEVLLIRRVEEGKQRLDPVPVDLLQLCGALVDEILSATNRVCPVEFRCGDLLEGARSDETLLRHILSNLLSNAIKYSQPGNPVKLSVDRLGQDAVFSVEDRGIGIMSEDRVRLFESFTRGRNVGDRPGSGLGLIVVKRCVDLHGGHIGLQSEPGVGTTFTITLPVFPQPHSTP